VAARVNRDLVQRDPALPTGTVRVTFRDAQTPIYDIVKPAAWDALTLTDDLRRRARSARALIFGSLAQRSETSRQTIRALLDTAACRVFDVNLRPPYDDRAVVEASLAQSDLVKLNSDELKRLAGWFGWPADEQRAAEALTARYPVRSVYVTRGAEGAALRHGGQWMEHPGYRVQVADTVGSGDAFLAALLDDLLAGRPAAAALARANAIGAYVASQPGATPPLDPAGIERVRFQPRG
jgi:fructokinase